MGQIEISDNIELISMIAGNMYGSNLTEYDPKFINILY